MSDQAIGAAASNMLMGGRRVERTACYNRATLMHRNSYRSLRERAKELFQDHPRIRCPYFEADVILNADGLHHLRYSDRRERSKPE